MSAGHTPVWDVRGDDGTTVHGKGGDVHQVAENTDPLHKLCSRAYHRIDDGTQTAYAWEGYRNRPELVAG